MTDSLLDGYDSPNAALDVDGGPAAFDADEELDSMADQDAEFDPMLDEGAAADSDDALDLFEGEALDDEAYDDSALDLLSQWDSPVSSVNAFEADLWDDEDALEGDDSFLYDEDSGLFVPPASAPLVSGRRAVAMARRLEPAVLETMDADDADAFFRRVRRAVRGLSGIGRLAGPLLSRALPMVQRVAGFAGPWGRLLSGGIGAIQGLARGQGLRGALAGAAGGLIPGIGGQLASRILGGEGADDDAALDALADMADAGEVDALVALPLGTGLAARMIVRRGLAGGPRPVLRGGVPHSQRIWRQGRQAERILMLAQRVARGSTGRRLRIARSIARLAAEMTRRQGQARGAASAAKALPRITRAAANRVLARSRQQPTAGISSPNAAARRNAQRRAIMRRVPISLSIRGRGHINMRA